MSNKFFGNKSILKFTLACAVLIGSASFNISARADNVTGGDTPGEITSSIDITNSTSLENGINNTSYYTNNNTLNILNSINLTSSLPTISNVADLVIQGAETEESSNNYEINGQSSLGYIIENSTLTINNIDFTNFSNPQQYSNENMIYGTALLVQDNTSSVTLNNVRFNDNLISTQAGSLVRKSLFGGAVVNKGSLATNNSIFNGNYTESIDAGTSLGGAVYNTGIFESDNTEFEENNANSVNGNAQGGAIHNAGGTVTLTDTDLNGNYTETTGTGSAQGGAVYNNGGTSSVAANAGSPRLSNNYTNSTGGGNAQGGAIYNANGTSSVSGINVSGNYSKATGNGNAQGGAVYNAAGTTTLSNSNISGNTVSSENGAAQGGAFYNNATGRIEGGEIANNSASSVDSNAQGGAVYNNNNMTISNATLSQNHADSENADVQGGAIYNANGTTTVSNSTLNENYANANGDNNAQGGAFYNNATGRIEGGEIANNSASSVDSNAQGGAVYNNNNMTISNATLSQNHADSENADVQGGAIYNANGTTTVSNSTLNENYANANGDNNAQGGALYNAGTLTSNSNSNYRGNSVSSIDGNAEGGAIYNSGTTTIQGGEISNNTAQATGEGNAYGGAVYNNGTLTLNGVTLSGNTAQTENGDALGGAIYNDGTLNLANSTFSGNSVSSTNGEALGSAIYTTGDITLQGGNTFEAGNDIYFAAGADGTAGSLLVNSSVSNTANIISGNLITADGLTSAIILSSGGNLTLNGDNTNFNGNAQVGADSTLTYGGDPSTSMLASTVVTGANGGVEFNFADDYTLEAGKVTTADWISGRFIKSGNNTLTLTDGDYSNFSGQVIVNAGTLSYIQTESSKYINATSNTINSGAILNYTNNIAEDTVLGLSGSGTFNKLGSQNLILDGANSGFSGNLNIQEGSLTFTKDANNSFVGGNVNLSSNTTLKYTSRDTDTLNLGSNSQFKFANGAAGATIKFTDGIYNFSSDLQNIANNSVNFNSATLSLSGTNYIGSYSITDSIIDMTDGRISNVNFGNLTMNGDNNLTIDFINGQVDKLTSSNGGSITLDSNDISFNLSADNGELAGEYQVLDGGLTFANGTTTTISSAIYNYTVSYVQGGNSIILTLDSLKNTTLYALNHEIEGERTFNYIGNGTYNIGQNLGTTLSGTLNINGRDNDTTDVISATDGNGNHLTMFELTEDDTILNISNVTIQDAQSSTQGSVINATAADAVINIENSVITNNTSARGGALYLGNPPAETTEEPEDPDTPVETEHPTITIKDSTFSNNRATGSAEDAETEIIGNGGALYLGASSPDVTVTNTTFSNNNADNFGGAVYNASGGNILFDNVTFENNSVNNTEYARGSAIYNMGSMRLNNASFSGNTGTSYIFNGTGRTLTLSADKEWTIDNATTAYIYNAGTLNLEQTATDNSNLTIADEIWYGRINTRGNITINDRIYSSIMNVNNGTLTLTAGTDENILDSVTLRTTNGTNVQLNNTNIFNGSIALAEGSTFNINSIYEAPAEGEEYEGIQISSDISGSGTFEKNGDGKLTFTGITNSSFDGILNINNGIVEFDKTTANSFFGSESSINVATGTEFIYNSTDTRENFLGNDFSNITLLGGAKLSVIGNGAGSSKFTIDDGWFTSQGETNDLLFSNAEFTLNGTFDRGDTDQTLDNLTFENAVISIGSGLAPNPDSKADFGSNNYTFTDSTLNFSNQTAGNNFIFDNLTFNENNNNLAIDLDLNGEQSFADMFQYTNGSGIINLTSLYIKADADFESTTIQIFDKNETTPDGDHIQISVAPDGGTLGWATNEYVYGIKTGITDTENDSIVISKEAESDLDTLRGMNIFGGEQGGSRGFSFIADAQNGEEYHIAQDLDETSAGSFTVVGDAHSATGKTILSGEIRDIQDEHASMFEIVNNTRFEMSNVSVEDALRDGTEVSRIHDGSAIYANDRSNSSEIILNNVDFKNNSVTAGNGGAIANIASGSMAIYNSVISGNSASGHGGAIYNTDDHLSILTADFDGNSADGLGGAIYTDKNLLISDSSFGTNRLNTHNGGELNDIYISGTNTRVSFVTNTGEESHINSGIAGGEGEGIFTKTGEGDLYVTGVNENFTGNFEIIAGDVTYTADDENDSFVGGTIEVSRGTNLTLDISENAGEQHIQDVSGYTNSNDKTSSGTLTKTGAGTLYLDGKNDNFTGQVTISEGSLTYTGDQSGEMYFGGPTAIEEGAALYLDIAGGMSNQTLRTVSGSGLFEKTGDGNIDLTGGNSGFNGTANIKGGSVTYKATTTTSSYFTGNTYLSEGATLIADISRRNSEGVLIEGQTVGNLSDASDSAGGNFTKRGEGDLQLIGDNSGLTGTTTVEEGLLTFTNQEEVLDDDGNPTGDILYHKYTGRDTVIAEGAELEFTAVTDDVINGLTGSGADLDGTFTKLGAGDLQLDGDNSTFKGDIALEEGSLTYDSVDGNGRGFLNNVNSIELADNTSVNIKNKEDDDAVLKDINGSSSTDINKNGEGKLTLQGDNSLFTGDLTIKNGNVAFTNTEDNNYISGNTIINKEGSLDYTSDTNDTLTDVSGNGTLNKDGSGTLTFNTADNNVEPDFTANINEGTLSVTGSNTSNIDFNVNVNNNSTFNYTAANSANITINGENDKIKFGENSNNANIIFNTGTYTLNGEIANATNEGNTITFNNSTINTGTSKYNADYIINNSTIDLTNDGQIGEVTFDSIQTMTGGNKLAIDVNLNIPGESTADKLNVTTPDGSNINFALTEINLTGDYDDGLNGLEDETGRENTHIVEDIVSGNATLSKDTSLTNWSTDIYEYNVDIQNNDVILTAIKASDNNSLGNANRLSVDADGTTLDSTVRGFQFRSEDGSTYTIGSDLGETYQGTFTVVGNNNTVSGGGAHSFFEITNDNTNFEIRNLTITNANSENGGSAILADTANSGINVDNVNFTNNTASGNGGAISNIQSSPSEDSGSTVGFVINGGNMTGNHALGLGGAIYTADDIAIIDTEFSGNTQGNNVKNDIYVNGTDTNVYLLTDDGMSVNSGLAGNGNIILNASTSDDGAEPLSGNLNLSGTNSNFTGNLYLNNGDLNFTQTASGDSYISGTTWLNGNTANIETNFSNTTAGNFVGDQNTGIEKTGAYNLTISGDNSQFLGTANINEGRIIFNANSANHKFFGGNTNISDGAGLTVTANTNTTLSNISNEGDMNVTANSSTTLSNINGNGNITKEGRGTMAMSGNNSNFTGNLTVNNGTFAMNSGATIGDITYGYFADGTTLTLQNSTQAGYPSVSLEDVYFNELNLDGNVNFDLDVDLRNQRADKIGVGTTTGIGNLIIDQQSINVVSDTLLRDSRVEIAYGDITDNILLDATTVMGPIQKYTVDYEEVLADPLNPNSLNRGYLTFARQGGGAPDISQVNMSAMASSVATQVGGYLTQLDTLNAGFFHMDRYSKYPYMLRLTAEKSNVNAITDTPAYSKSTLPETSNAMWVKPYTTFEQIDLKGGIDVSNVSYGALYGGDTDLVDLGHGFKGVLSMFLGYNGAHMSYNGISMNQQGGALGATGTLYKGNFFTGLTVSTGASAGEAYTAYGTDNFSMLTAGIASKTGYNWEINEGKLIVQPTLFLGYTFVNTFDYTNSAGVRMDSDPLHAIQIVPGVKLIGNLKNGWQPYIGVNMVWSIMDKTYVMANDVRLPQLSVKPYVEYGVGVQKSWGERFTAFFQTMIRNGGRTGVALTAGFRWALGKSPENSAKQKPVKKKVIKAL